MEPDSEKGLSLYSCSMRMDLVGFSEGQRAVLEAIAPLESFNHSFRCVDDADGETGRADAVFAWVEGQEGGALLGRLAAAKDAAADLIAIVPPGSFPILEPYLGDLADVWTAPLGDDELRFRFGLWQRRRKEAAEAWQTAQFLDATIDSIPSLVWYKTRDGIHEKVNESFCATVRKTKEQVQGRGHAYIWDVEQDDPACIESENEVMASRKTCVSEEMVQTGDGTRLLTTYKSPLYDLDGSVMGTVGVGIDITQERAYENNLIEKNRTLEAIFTSLDCGVLTHSLDGSRILGVNRTALDILGYGSEKELIDDGFAMISPSVVEEDRERLLEQISQLDAVGESVSAQYRVCHRDGSILHIMGDMKLIEKDGERYIQRFLLDITDQKQQEEQRERRQRGLLNALSQDYLVVCAFSLDDGYGEVLRVAGQEDSGLQNIFSGEVSLERTVGQYIDARVLEEDREMLREVLSVPNILAQLESKERFDRLYRADRSGVARYRQASVASVGADGEGRLVVIGFRNVDQQIREELEQKALLEEALGNANRANEAKSAFLLNMSHDIRTPMNAIVGFTTLAANHVEQPEKVGGYLQMIKTSSDHLLGLINDILDMSRIEQGKVSLDEGPCDLAGVFDDLESMLRSQAEAKGLDLQFDASQVRHRAVVCDRLKVNQVLLNLLGNSLKFTESGYIRARLVELPDAPAGWGSYRITVEDTGIGMSSSFLENIFDPFERERTPTISGIQGSGLGMAIVKNLVAMMKGAVEVESEEGKGTRFTVTVPFKLADAPLLPEESEMPGPGAFAAERAGRSRILLVDDNLLNREIAEGLLSDAGFKVETAVNGRDAVEHLQVAEPGYFDLVLMDIQMPVMNGYEAATAIRALPEPQRASIPILAVTADAFEEDRQRALDCGMNGHLAKPIEVDKLFGILDSVLEG